jgi:hypothetical protein
MQFAAVLLLSAASLASAFLPSHFKGEGLKWVAGHHNATAPQTCILGTQTGCSTDVVLGLTTQIIGELNAMGYTFKSLDSTWIHCSDPCVNQLQASAADSLAAMAKSKNDYITLNSAYRSCAQQYLLYNWYESGICGIGLAATPGTSNHEGGRAVDTSSYSYWLSTMEAYGWTHSYPSSDPVHFDCKCSIITCLPYYMIIYYIIHQSTNQQLIQAVYFCCCNVSSYLA